MDDNVDNMRVTVAEALSRLPLSATPTWPLGVWNVRMLAHGAMSVSLFAPKETDFQTPHEQDEVYIIFSGRGHFARDEEQVDFAPGDVLFVPAGVEHRFTGFSADFIAWVIFYGPTGGEAPH